MRAWLILKSIVFIDAAVEYYDALALELPQGLEIHILGREADGLAQIAAFLRAGSEDRPYDAVHIISHGSPGSLSLGNTTLDAETIAGHRAALISIGACLTADADILLYGCDVASGPKGRTFLEQLAILTGADVAGSDDPTGASSIGADIDLELRFGDVTANSLLDQSTLDSLNLVLAAPPSTFTPPGTSSWIWSNPFGDVPSVAASIGSTTEIDYYRFNPDASGSFTISVSGGTLDSILRVYNSSGTSIAGPIDTQFAGGTESATISLTAGLWYYIGVGGFGTGSGSTGTYSLSINGPTPFINDVVTDAPNFTGSVNGSISPAGDIDWFKLEAPAGTNTLSFSTTQLSGSLDTVLQLLDASGNSLLGVIDTGGAGVGDFGTSIDNGGRDLLCRRYLAGQRLIHFQR